MFSNSKRTSTCRNRIPTRLQPELLRPLMEKQTSNCRVKIAGLNSIGLRCSHCTEVKTTGSFYIGIMFKTVCFKVSHYLHTVQLWVYVLITT